MDRVGELGRLLDSEEQGPAVDVGVDHDVFALGPARRDDVDYALRGRELDPPTLEPEILARLELAICAGGAGPGPWSNIRPLTLGLTSAIALSRRH